MRDGPVSFTKIDIPQPKAYVVCGSNGYETKIALYKKPNLVFRLIIWWAGWRVEAQDEATKKEGE